MASKFFSTVTKQLLHTPPVPPPPLWCACFRDKPLDLSQDVIHTLYFLEEFTHYSYLPRRTVERFIPSYIFDEFKHRTM